LFNISEQFCQQILSDNYEPKRYRRFVEENYSLQHQLNKINDLFRQLEAEIDSQHTQTSTGNSEEFGLYAMTPAVFDKNGIV
jgi:hypothetical protein